MAGSCRGGCPEEMGDLRCTGCWFSSGAALGGRITMPGPLRTCWKGPSPAYRVGNSGVGAQLCVGISLTLKAANK